VHQDWQYCSTKKGLTTRGATCTGPCTPWGSYFWCNTQHSWDYCSLPIFNNATERSSKPAHYLRTKHPTLFYQVPINYREDVNIDPGPFGQIYTDDPWLKKYDITVLE
jgi:hypothetical protein